MAPALLLLSWKSFVLVEFFLVPCQIWSLRKFLFTKVALMTPLVRVHCIPMGRKIVFLPERFRTKIAYVGANLVVNCSFVLIEVALWENLFLHTSQVYGLSDSWCFLRWEVSSLLLLYAVLHSVHVYRFGAPICRDESRFTAEPTWKDWAGWMCEAGDGVPEKWNDEPPLESWALLGSLSMTVSQKLPLEESRRDEAIECTDREPPPLAFPGIYSDCIRRRPAPLLKRDEGSTPSIGVDSSVRPIFWCSLEWAPEGKLPKHLRKATAEMRQVNWKEGCSSRVVVEETIPDRRGCALKVMGLC